jgi:outer membrane protein TolC
MKSSIALVATVLGLSACTAFGPDRKPPRMPQPAHYSVDSQPAKTAEADGVAQEVAIGARPVPEWWKEFGSEDLNALVEEGLRNSPSYASAQSSLKAAREQLRGQIGDNLLPQVDLTFSPSRQRSLGIPVLPQQTFIENVFVAQAQATYTFDFFGAAFLADRALAGQVKQQALQLESTRRALATNIVVATINAASLQEQVAATEELVALGEARARQIAPDTNWVARPAMRCWRASKTLPMRRRPFQHCVHRRCRSAMPRRFCWEEHRTMRLRP